MVGVAVGVDATPLAHVGFRLNGDDVGRRLDERLNVSWAFVGKTERLYALPS